MSSTIRGLVARLPKNAVPTKGVRTLATISPSTPFQSTLHSTGNVYSLGHSIEHIPSKGSKGVSTQATHGMQKSDNGVWCVAGASGETKKFRDVPMGAFAVGDSFGPAWRRSL